MTIPSLSRGTTQALAATVAAALALLLCFGGAGCSGDTAETCGDGVAAGAETCDGADLKGQSCEGLGFGAGTLACKAGCGDFEKAGCGAPASCGDNAIVAPEVCDGADLGGKTCADLGFEPGALACAANCLDFDSSKCGPPLGCTPQCGGAVCGKDPACGKSCGDCQAGEACQQGACIKVCDLDPLTQSGALNLDLKVITVSGTVTVNGQPMPNDQDLDGNRRATLRFRDVKTGEVTEVSLGETGPASYSVPLYAGTYDVLVHSLGESYQTSLPPDGTTQILSSKLLEQSGALDLDLKVITVSGVVTVNGQPMPDDQDLDGNRRATLRFRDVKTGEVTEVSLGETGPASYTVPLYAGTYDVLVHSLGESYQTVLPPNGTTQIQSVKLLEESGALNLDLKVITVSGAVTVNGQPMPDDQDLDGNRRATLRFRDTLTQQLTEVSLGETGPASYTVPLYAGSYDVLVHSLGESYQTVLPPNGTTQLHTQRALQQSGALNLDLKVITVSGTVTVNGQPMPTDQDLDGNRRATLRFRDTLTEQLTEVSLGETGPASYTVPLYAGTYDVLVHSLGESYQTVLPPNGTTQLHTQRALQQSGALNLDLKVITVSGTVTVNGQPMPDDQDLDGNRRATLRFRDVKTGEVTEVSLGETGPASYTVPLYAGTYDVLVHSLGESYQTVLPPSGTTQLHTKRALQQSGALDLDLEVITVSGAVTVNGQSMPDDQDLDGNRRATLRFRDTLTQQLTEVSLGETGPASYTVRLYAGSYDVLIHSLGESYQTVLPPNGTTQLKIGCPP